MFSAAPEYALDSRINFTLEKSNERCLGYDDGRRLNDTEAAELIKGAADLKP